MKPESYRHKVAFFTATTISLAIFFSWAGFKGYIGLPNGEIAYVEPQNNTAAVISTPTPFDNSKNAFSAAMSQFSGQFSALKESLANVFVPFISGIEVYESE